MLSSNSVINLIFCHIQVSTDFFGRLNRTIAFKQQSSYLDRCNSGPVVEILTDNTFDMNFFFPKPNKGPSTTKLKPSHQTPSPHAEALAQIVANLGSVFELGHLDSEDLVFHVPNLVSQLVTGYLSGKKYQDLRQETDARNQEIVDFIRVSHLESQKKEAEWRGEEAQYITRIDDIREERDQQAQLREERENTIRTLETKWALHVADVNTKHEEAERRMKEKYEEKERRMKEDHEFLMQGLQGTIQALTTHMEKQKDEFVVEKTKLEEAHRTKQDDLTEKFEAHQTKLKQAHKKQQEQLQKEIQSRNKALIAREKFSPMTDGDLKSVFSDLVAEVNALARLEWTLNRSKWTDVLLRQVSDNPKRLQKQILKETIWNALFENIFCSPFRVFGEEGSVLESQWNKAFGKGKVPLATPDQSDPIES